MIRYRLMRGQRGVSLLEVLVAVVIFSIGMLGLALMQLKGAQFTKDAGSRTTAILMARSITDAMRANPAAARAPIPVSPATAAGPCPYCTTTYSTMPTVASACSGVASDGDAAAKCSLARWMDHLKTAMPGPSTGNPGSVTWDGTMGAYVIKTSWSGGKLKDTDSGNSTYSFTYMP